MDTTTLGAAIAIMKSLPDGAAASADRAEAAAEAAEAVAAKTLNVTWEQGTISGGNFVVQADRATSSLITGIAVGDVISGKNGVQVRPAFYRNGAWVATWGTAADTYTITSANVNNYDGIRIIASRTNNKEQITPEQARNAVSYTGSQTEASPAAAKVDVDAIDARLVALESITVPVTSTAPTITAVKNRIYKCGTVNSVSFNPCAQGLCELIFTSGSTPAVLTLPSTVKMPDWWTGTEANRVYDIMVMDGVYGVVTSWAN